tara:strand:+ start:12525 stop:13859 length:1335 start_codon:yes stop_codon:yes gene_type:complete
MKRKGYCALTGIWLAACLSGTPASAEDTLILTTDIFPPYQVREGEELGGTSVQALDCIFKTLRQPYSIRVMPWERAIYEVSQGKADGFFSATSTRRADRFAVLSAPLALEKWYWYSNQDRAPVRPQEGSAIEGPGADSQEAQRGAAQREAAPRSAGPRIGAVRGSNQLAWLLDGGYEVEQQVRSTEQLLQLLELGRIDTFLADQSTLRTTLTKLPLALRPEYERFQQYSTLGVYYSKRYLDTRTDFMQQFNKQIYACLKEIPVLTEQEREQLLTAHQQLFHAWPARPDIIAAVQAQNRRHQNLTIPDIMKLDQQWLDERGTQDSPLIDQVTSTELSQRLAEQQRDSNGLITEIIVTDRFGLNVGVSEITTDYWQGDEAKFSEAFFNRTNAIYEGQLEYDQSTQGYQVHISSQMRDPASDEIIGVLIIGLDIQRVLQANGSIGVK